MLMITIYIAISETRDVVKKLYLSSISIKDM